jgi:cell wall-associated NlpC family hydrolase
MMPVSFKYFNSLIIACAIAGIFFITGCSSSSNSIRYGSSGNNKTEKKTHVRYPDNKVGENSENDSDPDFTPDNVESVDISTFKEKYYSPEGISKNPSTAKEKMLIEIVKYMNTPYKFGGNTKAGIDCSAFTRTVYSSCSIQLLRSAREQFTQGIAINDKDNLRFGDLVFFNTRKTVKPGHVGIYIGDNLFVHASSSNGVIVTPLDSDYYSDRFMGARRIDLSSDFQ